MSAERHTSGGISENPHCNKLTNSNTNKTLNDKITDLVHNETGEVGKNGRTKESENQHRKRKNGLVIWSERILSKKDLLIKNFNIFKANKMGGMKPNTGQGDAGNIIAMTPPDSKSGSSDEERAPSKRMRMTGTDDASSNADPSTRNGAAANGEHNEAIPELIRDGLDNNYSDGNNFWDQHKPFSSTQLPPGIRVEIVDEASSSDSAKSNANLPGVDTEVSETNDNVIASSNSETENGSVEPNQGPSRIDAEPVSEEEEWESNLPHISIRTDIFEDDEPPLANDTLESQGIPENLFTTSTGPTLPVADAPGAPVTCNAFISENGKLPPANNTAEAQVIPEHSSTISDGPTLPVADASSNSSVANASICENEERTPANNTGETQRILQTSSISSAGPTLPIADASGISNTGNANSRENEGPPPANNTGETQRIPQTSSTSSAGPTLPVAGASGISNKDNASIRENEGPPVANNTAEAQGIPENSSTVSADPTLPVADASEASTTETASTSQVNNVGANTTPPGSTNIAPPTAASLLQAEKEGMAADISTLVQHVINGWEERLTVLKGMQQRIESSEKGSVGLSALIKIKDLTYKTFETVDAAEQVLKAKFPKAAAEGYPSVGMAEVQPPVDELAEYFIVLLEATLLSRRPDINEKMRGVLIVLMTQVLRILGYFMCESKTPDQSESIFLTINMALTTNDMLVKKYTQANLSFHIVNFWQVIRSSNKGPTYRQGALMDHTQMGPKKFMQRVDRFKAAYERNLKNAPRVSNAEPEPSTSTSAAHAAAAAAVVAATRVSQQQQLASSMPPPNSTVTQQQPVGSLQQQQQANVMQQQLAQIHLNQAQGQPEGLRQRLIQQPNNQNLGMPSQPSQAHVAPVPSSPHLGFQVQNQSQVNSNQQSQLHLARVQQPASQQAHNQGAAVSPQLLSQLQGGLPPPATLQSVQSQNQPTGQISHYTQASSARTLTPEQHQAYLASLRALGQGQSGYSAQQHTATATDRMAAQQAFHQSVARNHISKNQGQQQVYAGQTAAPLPVGSSRNPSPGQLQQQSQIRMGTPQSMNMGVQPPNSNGQRGNLVRHLLQQRPQNSVQRANMMQHPTHVQQHQDSSQQRQQIPPFAQYQVSVDQRQINSSQQQQHRQQIPPQTQCQVSVDPQRLARQQQDTMQQQGSVQLQQHLQGSVQQQQRQQGSMQQQQRQQGSMQQQQRQQGSMQQQQHLQGSVQQQQRQQGSMQQQQRPQGSVQQQQRQQLSVQQQLQQGSVQQQQLQQGSVQQQQLQQGSVQQQQLQQVSMQQQQRQQGPMQQQQLQQGSVQQQQLQHGSVQYQQQQQAHIEQHRQLQQHYANPQQINRRQNGHQQVLSQPPARSLSVPDTRNCQQQYAMGSQQAYQNSLPQLVQQSSASAPPGNASSRRNSSLDDDEIVVLTGPRANQTAQSAVAESSPSAPPQNIEYFLNGVKLGETPFHGGATITASSNISAQAGQRPSNTQADDTVTIDLGGEEADRLLSPTRQLFAGSTLGMLLSGQTTAASNTLTANMATAMADRHRRGKQQQNPNPQQAHRTHQGQTVRPASAGIPMGPGSTGSSNAEALARNQQAMVYGNPRHGPVVVNTTSLQGSLLNSASPTDLQLGQAQANTVYFTDTNGSPVPAPAPTQQQLQNFLQQGTQNYFSNPDNNNRGGSNGFYEQDEEY